ncbi:Anion transporter, partial [Actinobacillus pleuropneumoniae serovar 4 str. M62]
MTPSAITLCFLVFAIVMFALEKLPLAVTAMIVTVGLAITGVLPAKDAFLGLSILMLFCLLRCLSSVE